jgi:predicted permease
LLTLILRLLPLVPEVYNQAVVNAFMPSAAISTILTYRFGGDPQLAASTVFATTLASLITVPLGLTWALG